MDVEKIRNMWKAHNDGVYMLNTRENIGEIVGFLLQQIDEATPPAAERAQCIQTPPVPNDSLEDVYKPIIQKLAGWYQDATGCCCESTNKLRAKEVIEAIIPLAQAPLIERLNDEIEALGHEIAGHSTTSQQLTTCQADLAEARERARMLEIANYDLDERAATSLSESILEAQSLRDQLATMRAERDSYRQGLEWARSYAPACTGTPCDKTCIRCHIGLMLTDTSTSTAEG